MKARKKALLGIATISAAILINTGSAQALLATGDMFGLDFRFNNPGARANAMGGAFVGLADDATAAYTNPAGLTVLTKPEISVEYKAGDYTTRILDARGTTDTDKSASGLSFLSYVYPAKNTTVAIFRHQLMNSRADFSFDDGGSYPTNFSVESQINTLGLGLGTKLGDKLSLGLAVGLAQLDHFSTALRYQRVGDQLVPFSKEKTNSTDNAEQYSVSMLWNVTEKLNLGLVYRQGPKFKIKDFTEWYFDPNANGGAGAWTEMGVNAEGEFKVPDVYGLGLSYRFAPNLTVAMDANYVKYSQLIDEMLYPQESNFIATQEVGFKVDDKVELRLGLEYVLDLADSPLALRCGYYYRPDHRVYYEGDTTNNDAFQYLTKGKDDHIGSLGVGFLINPNLQIDLAGSMGKFATEGFASVVYRFE